MNLPIIIGVLEQSLIYSIVVMGVYITYHILDIPDLTVDGSFPLGGAVGTYFILQNYSLPITFLFIIISGALAGFATGILNVKFKITNLLSSILTMTGLYSINIGINNSSNEFLLTNATIFNKEFHFPKPLLPFKNLLIIFLIVVIVKLALDYFFKSKAGMLMRGTGDNKQIITSLGKSPNTITVIGLMISNALVALGGGIYIQHQRSFDASMGTGTMVLCLASVIIGLQGFKKLSNTTAVIFGSIIYNTVVSFVISISIRFGFKAYYSRLIMTILFALVLIYNNYKIKNSDR